MTAMAQGLLVLGSFVVAVLLGLLCFWANPASLPNYLMTVLNAVLALFAYASEPQRKVNRAFALLALLMASWGADVTFLFIAPTQDIAANGIRFVRIGLIYLLPCMIYFIMVFTRRELPRWPLWLALAWATMLAVVSIGGWMDSGMEWRGKNWAPKPNSWYHAYSLMVFVVPIYGTWLTGTAWRRETDPRLRLQFKQFFVAFLIMAVLGWTNQIATYLDIVALRGVSFYGSVGGLVFFIVLAFGIVRNGWLDISFVVRRTLLYSTLTAAIAGTYGLILFLFNTLFQPGEQSSFAASVATIAIVAFAFMPARQRLQTYIDRIFYRDAYDERLLMEQIAQTVARVIGNREIARTILDQILPAMKIRNAQILLGGKIYAKSAGEDLIEREAPPLARPDRPVDRTEPAEAHRELMAYMNQERLELALPIMTLDGPAGILLIGPKLSELPYRPEEMQLLRTIAQQTGIAADNSRLYEEVLSVKNYNENILLSMDDGLITFDSDGRLISANPAARRILRHGANGNPSTDALPPGSKLPRILKETLEKGSGVRHVEIESEGDRTLLVTSTPLISREGRTTGGLILFSDITDKKEMERRLERDRRLAMIGELASQVAHEIRNPIGSMKIMVDSLAERRNDPRFEKAFMETLPSEIDRLNRLVGDLLDFSRPPRLIRVDLDLVKLIEVSLRLTQDDVNRNRIEVRCELPPGPATVNADGEKLKQVLINLIRNAAQAMHNTPSRILTIRLADRQLDIVDTGVGMNERQLAKIFTPFFSTKAEGTGLGLAIVHRIVEEHGWAIEATSQPGSGTTFRIRMNS